MASQSIRTSIYVSMASLGAVLVVLVTACASIGLTLFLKAILAAILHALATIGEIGIATVAAISSGFTISLTVILAASVSAITFPPSHIQARLIVSVTVATASMVTSAMALFFMTSFHLDLELAIAVVSSAAVSVALASGWAVGVMSLIERETSHVGLKMTSLLQTVRNNQYNVLSILVYLPFGSQKEDITAALMYAVKADFEECVRILLSVGADPNGQDAYENTPLAGACQTGSATTLRRLLQAGAKVNFCNNKGECALHHAAKWGHEDCIQLLLENGADVNIQDNLGRTSLMLATGHARTPFRITHMLIDAGSNVNALASDNRSTLHYAAVRGIPIQSLLDASVMLDIQDAEGNTALHLSAIGGNNDVTLSLLKAGADQSCTNYMNRSPIHLAASQGHVLGIKKLLEYRADPMQPDNAGHLPINHGVSNNKPAVVLLFLKRKYFYHTSLTGSSTKNAINPLRVALEKNFFHIARMLVLGGCDCSPLRQRDLMMERRFWRDDSQMFHFIWLHQCLEHPRSLIQSCRLTIRNILTCPITDIRHLPIPKQLRNFLALDDLNDFMSVTDMSSLNNED